MMDQPARELWDLIRLTNNPADLFVKLIEPTDGKPNCQAFVDLAGSLEKVESIFGPLVGVVDITAADLSTRAKLAKTRTLFKRCDTTTHEEEMGRKSRAADGSPQDPVLPPNERLTITTSFKDHHHLEVPPSITLDDMSFAKIVGEIKAGNVEPVDLRTRHVTCLHDERANDTLSGFIMYEAKAGCPEETEAFRRCHKAFMYGIAQASFAVVDAKKAPFLSLTEALDYHEFVMRKIGQGHDLELVAGADVETRRTWNTWIRSEQQSSTTANHLTTLDLAKKTSTWTAHWNFGSTTGWGGGWKPSQSGKRGRIPGDDGVPEPPVKERGKGKEKAKAATKTSPFKTKSPQGTAICQNHNKVHSAQTGPTPGPATL